MRILPTLLPVLIATSLCSAASPELAPSPTVPAAAAEAGKDVVHQLNNAFAKVFEIVAPSVVIIETSRKSDRNEGSSLDDLLFGNPPEDGIPHGLPPGNGPVQSEGSGFIFRADGYILTNFHVVEGADKIDVKLKDGRELQGKIVGTDEKTDIAVVKIEAKDLPAVEPGDSDAVRVGQFAFAIGAPYKLDYTFTYGVVSGKGRNNLLSVKGYSIPDYIQTDASINPGNSGGPLCDIDGKVIGMNTLINGLNRGLGFAIPINLAKAIGTELIASHKIVRPWLGIEIRTLGEEPFVRDLFKGIDKGVVVRTVQADTPASKTDLKPGDVITHVDGAAIATDTQLQHEVLKKRVGQNVELSVWRKGQTLKIPIKTGELPNEVAQVSNAPAQPQPPKQEPLGKFGLQVQELSREMVDRLHLNVTAGVIVTDVAEDGIAEGQGIEREDVITEVDNKPVTNVQSFRDALNKADPTRGVLLYLDRKGNKTFAVLKAGNS